jgi:hypothetical protein
MRQWYGQTIIHSRMTSKQFWACDLVLCNTVRIVPCSKRKTTIVPQKDVNFHACLGSNMAFWSLISHDLHHQILKTCEFVRAKVKVWDGTLPSLQPMKGRHIDAGASSASTCGRTTQCPRTNPEPRIIANTANILKLIEKNKRKDHARRHNEHA